MKPEKIPTRDFVITDDGAPNRIYALPNLENKIILAQNDEYYDEPIGGGSGNSKLRSNSKVGDAPLVREEGAYERELRRNRPVFQKVPYPKGYGPDDVIPQKLYDVGGWICILLVILGLIFSLSRGRK